MFYKTIRYFLSFGLFLYLELIFTSNKKITRCYYGAATIHSFPSKKKFSLLFYFRKFNLFIQETEFKLEFQEIILIEIGFQKNEV